MSKIISLLLAGLLLAACGGMPASEENTPAPLGTPTKSPGAECIPPETWSIEFNRSGGIAGFDQRLTVDSSGTVMIESERPPADVEATLPPAEVERIGDMLVEACPFEPLQSQGACADCFQYGLEVQMDNRFYSVQATDATLTPDMQELFNVLNQHLQELPPQ